jgi:hypothetical protein
MFLFSTTNEGGFLMRKVLLVTALTLILAGCGRVVLPHRTMSYSEACPGFQKVRCHPDDDRRALIFNKVPPPLTIKDEEPQYMAFLGRAYRQPYRTGDIGRPCNNAVPTLFTEKHMDTSAATGSFEYSYELKSALKAGADADLVKAATAAGLPPAATEKVQAAAEAAYNREKERKVATTGRMHVIRFPREVLDEIRFGTDPDLQACRDFLSENPDYALVKAMTVFHIDDSTSDTQITDDITASVTGSLDGVDGETLAKVNAAIERSVKENIQTALSDRYLVWAVSWLRPEDL